MVHLYFHVIWSDRKNNITGGSASGIDRLTFLNHTKCECKSINYKPRSLTHHHHHQPKQPSIQSNRPMTIHHHHHHHSHHHSNINDKCRHVINCTEPFERRYRSQDNRCICDCLDTIRSIKTERQKHCQAIQSGIAKLDHFGARCVRTEKCAEPICAIGLRYNTTESRCVKDRRFRRHKVHHHHHQQQQNGRRHHLRHRHHHHEDMFEENDDNEDDENEHWFD